MMTAQTPFSHGQSYMNGGFAGFDHVPNAAEFNFNVSSAMSTSDYYPQVFSGTNSLFNQMPVQNITPFPTSQSKFCAEPSDDVKAFKLEEEPASSPPIDAVDTSSGQNSSTNNSPMNLTAYHHAVSTMCSTTALPFCSGASTTTATVSNIMPTGFAPNPFLATTYPSESYPPTSFIPTFPAYTNPSYYSSPVDSMQMFQQLTTMHNVNGDVRVRTSDKYRTVYSEQIRAILENEFNMNEFLNTQRKEKLACELDLTERQVKIWFQNRRAKKRKVGKDQIPVQQMGVYMNGML